MTRDHIRQIGDPGALAAKVTVRAQHRCLGLKLVRSSVASDMNREQGTRWGQENPIVGT